MGSKRTIHSGYSTNEVNIINHYNNTDMTRLDTVDRKEDKINNYTALRDA